MDASDSSDAGLPFACAHTGVYVAPVMHVNSAVSGMRMRRNMCL